MRAYREICSGEKSFASLEYRVRRKDGEVRTVRSNASPLLDEQGKIAGVVASMRDITELKRLEQQAIQTEKLAAMGQLIAGIAHELNNPLTAILGVSELLRDRATDDAMRRQLDLTNRQARRAAHIVKSLLSFSWPHSPGKTRVQLGEVVQRTLQLHDHSLRINNVTVEFTPRLDLPLVVGDADQLVQVFLNIIGNAEHAIREVRDHGTLRVGLVSDGKFVRITFEDDGAGIKPDDLPRLFDPFFTTKRPGRGTGLGLSICLAIVKEHGGEIEAQSVPGGGALFTVSLPTESELPKSDGQGAEELEAAAAQGRGHALAATQSALHGRSILVVDDEEGIRELVQDGLAAQGMRVDCAATGEEALRLVAERAYDSVLCDLNLSGGGTPAISGKKLFEHICRRAAAEPHWAPPAFLFMTGDITDPAALQESTRAPARVVYKPFQISDLAAALVEALRAPERSKP